MPSCGLVRQENGDGPVSVAAGMFFCTSNCLACDNHPASLLILRVVRYRVKPGFDHIR